MKLEELFGDIDLKSLQEKKELEESEQESEEDIMNLDDDDLDPFQKHLLNAIKVAMKEELNPSQSDFLWKYYVEEMSMGEIAKATGKHETSVKRTIECGEKNLRRIIRFAHPDLLKFSIEELTPHGRRQNSSTYLNTRYNWKKDKDGG